MQDLQYALRSLRKHPGFSVLAVLTLALAIGAVGAIFSVMNAVVLRPLPYRSAGRLAVLWKIIPAKNHEWDFTSYPVFADWRRQNHTFEDIALISRLHFFTVTAPDGPEQLEAVLVSANFFSMLGVAPEMGRYYTPEDERQGAQVIVLSHAFWRRWFGSSRDALGKSVQVNGRTLRVIGVMPPAFQFPYKQTQFWGLNTADERWPKWQTIRFADAFFGLGRLQPGLGFEQAQADMSAISRRLAHDFPDTDAGLDVRVVPLPLQIAGGPLRRALWMLFIAVLLVLVIACLNVAGLFLIRGAARQQEFALRAALGAGRRLLIRQMLTEGAVFAVLAAILGLALAAAGTRALVAFGPSDVARLDQSRIDLPVLTFTIAVALGSVFIFALAPAWRLSESTLYGSMRRFRTSLTGRALVVTELALSLVLLTGAGLLIRSFIAIEGVDPGFRPERVLTMKITLPDSRYSKERVTAFFDEAIHRVESLPGVSGAALGGVFSGDRLPNINIILEERPTDIHSDLTGGYDVSDRYFEILGIPLLSGRLFSELDRRDSQRVAIINQTMARRYWPGEDPIGKRFKGTLPGMLDKSPWCTVIGVVGDTVSNGRESRTLPMMYLSHRQLVWAYAKELLVRTSVANPLQLAEAVTREIRSIDKTALRSGVTTVEAHMDELNARRRFQMWLLALFASVALLLAAIGVFGLVHYSVSQRTAEMGIRMALGAQPRSIFALVIRQGLALALIGAGLGFLGASWSAHLLAGWLYGVTPSDPLTLASVAGLLVAAVAAASYLPARKAARIDPIQALRHE